MRHMKKLISMLLAVLVLITLSTTALAGTIWTNSTSSSASNSAITGDVTLTYHYTGLGADLITGYKLYKANVQGTMKSGYTLKNIHVVMTSYGYGVSDSGVVSASYRTYTKSFDVNPASSGQYYEGSVPDSGWAAWTFKGYLRVTATFYYFANSAPGTTLSFTHSTTYNTPSNGY